MKSEGGEACWIRVERGKCPACGHIHTILPDKLIPYKQYKAEIISGVIDGTVTQDDEETEDYPCEETMRRWLQWFAENHERIEGYLRNACMLLALIGIRIPEESGRVFPELRKQTERWLETALRIIINTGGRLAAVY